MKKIPLFKPYFRIDETLAEIKDCLENSWTGIGYKTEIFETEWKNYSSFKFAHFLNSATSGLHLALNIFKHHYSWKNNDEVITSPLTFISTNSVILQESLKPVFADIDDSLCLSSNSVESLITEKTKALIYVGIGGNTRNYRKIKEICKSRGIIFILDAAHMAGSKWKKTNKQVGIGADCAIFSFQAVKNCPSSDAGMICFKNEKLDSMARNMSWLGIDKTTYQRSKNNNYVWKYDVTSKGFKYHGNSINASMCLVSLRYLDEDNEIRRQKAALYDKFLDENHNLEIIRHDDDLYSSRHLYQIAVDKRDELIQYMASKGISLGVHYQLNSYFKIFKNFNNNSIPTAENYSSRIVSLPMSVSLTDDDVRLVAREICDFLKASK